MDDCCELVGWVRGLGLAGLKKLGDSVTYTSVAMQMRSWLFWDVTQRTLIVKSPGFRTQPVGPSTAFVPRVLIIP